MLSIIFIIILIIPILLYFFQYLKYQDLSLPKISLKKYKKVLVIYPHPDDEVMMSVGLIEKLIKNNSNVEVVSLTKGERGNEVLDISPDKLGEIRAMEFKKVMNLLKVEKSSIYDFGDGELERNYEAVKLFMIELIKANKYDLVVTYEKYGLYGHSDHVALSKVVAELQKELQTFDLLLSTMPRKITKVLNIKKHMRNDVKLADFDWNEDPNVRISIWLNLIKKYRAAKLYKSQKLSHGMPLWLSILVMPVEYYRKVG